MNQGTMLRNIFYILEACREGSGSRVSIIKKSRLPNASFYESVDAALEAGYVSEKMVGRIRWTSLTPKGAEVYKVLLGIMKELEIY